eukprot:2981884-Amphidinium_carterae.1
MARGRNTTSHHFQYAKPTPAPGAQGTKTFLAKCKLATLASNGNILSATSRGRGTIGPWLA